MIHLPIELAGANSPAPLIMALLEVKEELFLMEDPKADPPDFMVSLASSFRKPKSLFKPTVMLYIHFS